MLRFLTSGESHGKMLSAILEGMPAGLEITLEDINIDLARRQGGYGRGARSTSIEKDQVEIISGVRWGQTTGSPIGLLVHNKDWENRKKEMSIYAEDADLENALTRPRPGHADLAGMLKYGIDDARAILERASARNTATLVAVGAICKKYLKEFDIDVVGYVRSIGDIDAGMTFIEDVEAFKKNIEASQVRCIDKNISMEMITMIDKAKESGDTLGGVVCVHALNVPAGLGSYIEWDERLDAELARVVMGIPSVKAVWFGDEYVPYIKGSEAHDAIYFSEENGLYRKTNHAGGLEGGMSNGEDITVSAGLKPIPTLFNPLPSVDIRTNEEVKAGTVRSDVCVAPSAVVVVEAMVSFAIAKFHQKKFGGDNIDDVKKNVEAYFARISE